jgi:hypothetical protein
MWQISVKHTMNQSEINKLLVEKAKGESRSPSERRDPFVLAGPEVAKIWLRIYPSR